MAKKIANNKTLAIALLIALALMFVPVPLINGGAIAQIIVLVVALIMLLQ